LHANRFGNHAVQMWADSISPNHIIEVISLFGYMMVTGSDGHTLGYFLILNRREKRLLVPQSTRNIPRITLANSFTREGKQKSGMEEEYALFYFLRNGTFVFSGCQRFILFLAVDCEYEWRFHS
jgi:hypothetical protein